MVSYTDNVHNTIARIEASSPSHNGGDEELRAVGIRPGISHREKSLLGVLKLEVLIGKLLAVDYNQSVRSYTRLIDRSDTY